MRLVRALPRVGTVQLVDQLPTVCEVLSQVLDGAGDRGRIASLVEEWRAAVELVQRGVVPETLPLLAEDVSGLLLCAAAEAAVSAAESPACLAVDLVAAVTRITHRTPKPAQLNAARWQRLVERNAS